MNEPLSTRTAPSAVSVAALSRRIGTSELLVHPVSLGASVFGWTVSSARAFDILDRYVELGGNLVDTADAYSSGMSELIIGNWLRERRMRDRLLVATKIGRHPDFPGLSPRSIRGAIDASLARLQTDRIDLLYFHAEDPDTPIEQSLEAVDELVRAGKIRALGASNFSTQELLNARVAAGNGLPHFDAVTLEYNLLKRDIVEGDMTLLSQVQGLSIIPYFVLAHGFLGRHRNLNHYKGDDTRLRRAAAHSGRRGVRVLRVLDHIAMSHGVDVSTVATAWVLAKKNVASAVVGVENTREVEALMDAAAVRLSPAQIAELDHASER